VLAEDETHINLLPWVQSTWILKSSRQRVMTPGTNRRLSIFGAIDLASGRFRYPHLPQGGQRHLHRVRGATPGRLPVGARRGGGLRQHDHHRSKLVCAWLATPSPHPAAARGALQPAYNPVERIRGALKAWLANSPTLTMAGRLRQAHAFFRQHSPAQRLATTAPHSSPWLSDSYGQNFRQAA
jgi:hypothetical protein